MAGKSSSERRPAGEVDVVVEAVGGGRPEGEPGAGEEPQDGPGHDVRGRVPQDVERLAVPRASGGGARSASPVAVLERAVEVDDRAVGHGGDGRLGQPLADPLGDLAGPDPLGIFLDRPIRQLDLDHRRRPARCGRPFRRRPRASLPPTHNAGAGPPRLSRPHPVARGPGPRVIQPAPPASPDTTRPRYGSRPGRVLARPSGGGRERLDGSESLSGDRGRHAGSRLGARSAGVGRGWGGRWPGSTGPFDESGETELNTRF